MANKLLQQQIRNILRSLQTEELNRLLTNYMSVSKTYIEKSVRMISYKCYEATVSVNDKKINGYGRTEAEATTNAINNIFELLLEEEKNISLIKTALTSSKSGAEPSNHEKAPAITAQEHTRPIGLGESSKMITGTTSNTYSKTHHIPPNYLATSGIPQNNNSFLRDSEVSMSLDLEGLSKNIGQNNISIIGNSSNFLNSQLEIDDVLLKIMQDEGHSRGKHPGSYGGGYQTKTITEGHNKLRNSSHDSNKANGPPPVRPSSPPKMTMTKTTKPHSRYEVVANASYEKTELTPNPLSSSEQTMAKPIFNDMRKNTITFDSTERITKSPRSTNESGFGINGSKGGVSNSQRKNLSQTGVTMAGGASQCCSHFQELRVAIEKIEALETRLALLTEENEGCKRIIHEQDQKLKELESKSAPKENLFSKEFSSTLSKNTLLGKSAQLTQKILTEIHNLQVSQDEITDNSPLNLKGRSSSVDIQLQKKKGIAGNTPFFIIYHQQIQLRQT
eukprot:TRINITY_DN3934_c0_g1_i3.p1 TRINITY_DN3934_c0_g1~~TRINITY_DN3934_c0_g1_i3.p1  ORF type:complete len:505 (-),score=80.56 TRINITY_DN3934_c0_g1_i3:406-1920(-)